MNNKLMTESSKEFDMKFLSTYINDRFGETECSASLLKDGAFSCQFIITNNCTIQKITRSLIDYKNSMCNKDIFKAVLTNSNLQVVKFNTGN